MVDYLIENVWLLLLVISLILKNALETVCVSMLFFFIGPVFQSILDVM